MVPRLEDIAALTLPAGKLNKVIQVAWVVNELETAVSFWTRLCGVGPFYLFRDVRVDRLLYRGAPARMTFDVALAQAGGVQLEFITQHGNDPSAYRDLYPVGREGFHHVAFFAEDYDREIAVFDRQGYARATEGQVGEMRFSYIDTSASVGCMIELLEENARMRGIFAGVARAAEHWDGGRPLRPVEELLTD